MSSVAKERAGKPLKPKVASPLRLSATEEMADMRHSSSNPEIPRLFRKLQKNRWKAQQALTPLTPRGY